MWIIALIGFAFSLLDAFLTNQIGYEANPLLIPLLGSGLYLVKMITLPLWLFLAYYAHKNNVMAATTLCFGTLIYFLLVVSEVVALLC